MKLAHRVATSTPSVTLQITAKAKALKAEGVNVISFGAGEPDFDTPEFIKEKAIEALRKGFTKYTPESGTVELKKAIVEKFKRENGLVYTEKNIIVSCGAKHSLYNIFQALIDAGDEVLIPSPYWLSYPEMVKLAGGTPVFLETRQEQGFKITPRMVEQALTPKTKALVINSPSNPTGGIYTRDELAAIATVAASRDLVIISDEIYEHLVYDGNTHVSVASLSEDIKKHTITVNGVSKSYSMTGWRIGYLAAEEPVAKAIATIQSHATSNPTSFAQVGAVAALASGTDSIRDMVKVFERRRNIMLDELAAIKTIVPFKPEGAFYVFCDISRTGMTGMVFATQVLEEAKVAVIPGEPFGSSHHMRLSFAMDEKDIIAGVRRIKDWLAKK